MSKSAKVVLGSLTQKNALVLVVLNGNAKKKMPRRQGAVEASEGRSTRCGEQPAQTI